MNTESSYKKDLSYTAVPGSNGTMYHIMCEDILADDVFVSDDHKTIIYIVYEPPGMTQPFSGGTLDLYRFYRFLKSRCFEDCRADLQEILEAMELPDNNPWEFVKKTHGATYEDHFWIKFKKSGGNSREQVPENSRPIS